MEKNSQTFTTIDSKKSFFNLKELFKWKDLFYFMVLRDVTVVYKQTVLGFAWAILNPLFQILIFSVVFGLLAGIKPDVNGMPYFVFSALSVLPWTYFSSSVSSGSNSLISTSGIFTKVYFPRIIIPIVPVFSKMIDFLISFVIIISILFYYKIVPGINILLILIPISLIIITAIGFNLWLSSLALQYRDFKFILGFLLPLLMYAAPVTFPASLVLSKFGYTAYKLYGMYPMVGAIEGFRSVFIADKAFPWDIVFISYMVSIIFLFSGMWFFSKTEKHFADVV